MSAKTDVLHNVLGRTEKGLPDLSRLHSDELKRAARFWCGPAAHKFRREQCLAALAGLEHDETQIRAALPAFSAEERRILGIFQRYGGAMSGPLLLGELIARGIIPRVPKVIPPGTFQREKDPVDGLCARLALVRLDARYHHYHSSYGYARSYPHMALLAGLRPVIEAAAPLAWSSSGPSPVAVATELRTPGEVVFDLVRTVQAFGQMQNWATTQNGSLTKTTLNRLRKLNGSPADDVRVPPDLESLYYELFRGQQCVKVRDNEGRIDLALAARTFQASLPVQGWNWVRTWLQTDRWKDGAGAIVAGYEEPARLASARELVAWALSQVAHGPNQWLELNTFLADFWALSGGAGSDFYSRSAWEPGLDEAKDKEGIPPGPERQRAYWMADVGKWVANVVLVTMFHLGMVERGRLSSGQHARHCFRLTPLGRAVFGAPEIGMADQSYVTRFLTVQPNHEVVAYLVGADPRKLWPLALLTRATSASSGPVQTLTLTALSVYAALESGMLPGQIQEFLAEHSMTGLPANVAQSLAEWTRKRESLAIRTGVTLQVYSDRPDEKKISQAQGRIVGDHFVLLPEPPTRFRQECVWDHGSPPRRSWEINEDGFVRAGKGADAVGLARLNQFADPTSAGWQISAASIRRAKTRGISVEQILSWIHAYERDGLPPLVEMAIRNWSGRAVIFAGPLVMVQIKQPQAYEALRNSERFRSLVMDCLPPAWFVIHPEKHEEAVHWLQERGFTFAASFVPSTDDQGQEESSFAESDGRRPRPKRKKRPRGG